MNFFKKLSIREKLIVIITTVLLFALSSSFLAFYAVISSTLREELLNNMNNTAKILADYSISPLEFGDKQRAIEVLDKLRNEPQIACVQIRDDKDEVFAFYNIQCELPQEFTLIFQPKSFFDNENLHLVQPVVFENQTLGRVYLRASLREVNNKLTNIVLYMIFTALAVIFFAVAIAVRIQKFISSPIKSLTAVTMTVSETDDYTIRAQKKYDDEIGILSDAFNDMMSQIERNRRIEAESRQALSLSEKKYRNIFETSMVGIFRISMEEGRLIDLNKVGSDILGLSQADPVIGYVISVFTAARIRKKVREEGLLEKYEISFMRKDGRKTWLSISGRLFADQNYFEGIFNDITNEKESFIELKKLNFELDNFVYHTSHDLRSPLLSILGLITISRSENSLESIKSYFDLIEKSIKKLDTLVTNLLNLSRNSRVDEKKQLVDFKKLINESVEILNLNRPANLEIAVEVEQPHEFVSDPTRINIVLNNIISNAIKYQNPSEDHPFVKIHAQVSQEEAVITISDNGLGIPTENQGRIFEMFFRATDQGQGSGLGLYIVKNVLEKLKGHISFVSYVRRGTTFTIRIPNAIIPGAQYY